MEFQKYDVKEKKKEKKEKLNKAKLHRMFKFESTVRSHSDSR